VRVGARYSGFTSSVNRTGTAERLFPQEKAAWRAFKMLLFEVKSL